MLLVKAHHHNHNTDFPIFVNPYPLALRHIIRLLPTLRRAFDSRLPPLIEVPIDYRENLRLAEIKTILERAFMQFKDASFEFGWHSVSVAGSVALVAADVILHIKTSDREMSEQVRLTVALERRGNKWLIIQWHDSLPAAGQKEGQAFAT